MRIEKIQSANRIDITWNKLIVSAYQKIDFLSHLEAYNPCKQRYYLLYDNDELCAGAIVYSLKMNILTFSKFNLNLPFSILGIPTSVDASGMIGNEKYYEFLVQHILKDEKGITLCLNYDNILGVKNIVQMQTLPTLIFKNDFNSLTHYCESLKHNYRRRISQAQKKFLGVEKLTEPCSSFNDEHYNQYISIMKRTKTKLELLNKEFFVNLCSDYTLHSFYINKILLTWHITTKNFDVYYFLFGGINYQFRDIYDSYYNNLISIIQEGIELECKTMSLGQTAEISKNRLGAKLIPQRMFIHHSNKIINTIFLICKNFLTYKTKTIHANIYKSNL